MDRLADLPFAALQKLQTGVLVVNGEQRVCLINPWLLDAMSNPAMSSPTLPAAPVEAIGQPLLTVFPELAGSRLLRAVQQALEQGLPSVLSPGLNPHPLRLYGRALHGDEAPAMAQSVQVVQLRLADAVYCLISVLDVSASMRREALLREQADKLSSLSLTDELTGIANRRRLNQHLADELRRAGRTQRPMSVILLDIDHFKGYNDHYGHLAGDDCLIRISSTLQSLTLRAGDLVARYGGEEFCVVLADTDESAALLVAENLREQVERLRLLHPANSTGPLVTISLGVAGYCPSSQDSATILLLKADRALYRAKQNGRNCSVGHVAVKS